MLKDSSILKLNDYTIPLDIQTFNDEAGEGEVVEQQSLGLEFTMNDFTAFLANNKDAQTFFGAKVDATLLEKQEAIKAEALEQAKRELESQKAKPAWQVEIDNLKAENEAIRLKAVKDEIKNDLSAKLVESKVGGIAPEFIHKFCLRDTMEDSIAAYEEFMSAVELASNHKVEKEIEKRMNGYVLNPQGGSRVGSGNGAKDQLSVGQTIAKGIAESMASIKNNTRDTAKHFNL